MGRTVYLPTRMVNFYGFHVGEYTSPMDPMGKKPQPSFMLTSDDHRLLEEHICRPTGSPTLTPLQPGIF